MAGIRGTAGDDLRTGTAEADRIEGLGGDDRLFGGPGEDDILGGAGSDQVVGGVDNDYLEGGPGDDTLDASADTDGFGDFIRPGLGADTIIGSERLFEGGEGIDLSYSDVSGVGGLTIEVGADGTGRAVSGTPGAVDDSFTYAHFFHGSRDADTMIGSDADRFEGWDGGAGADTIDGGGGFDLLDYRSGANSNPDPSGVRVDLATGTATDSYGDTDTISGIEAVRGTEMADTIVGDDADNQLEGRGGDDELVGGGGRDRLRGGEGDDTLDSSGGSAESQSSGDVVSPGSGANTIIGNAEAYAMGGGLDLIYTDVTGSGGVTVDVGPDGSGTAVSAVPGVVDDTFTFTDHVEGTMQGDTFRGSAEEFESWVGEGGDDTIDGGGGTDRLQYYLESDGTMGVTVDLGTGTATDGFGDTDTLFGIEDVSGTEFADTLAGDDDDNRLFGRDGDDTLSGAGGNDYLQGGAGSDRAVFNVNRDAAEVSVDGDEVRVVSEAGTDTLRGIETLGFADGDISVPGVVKTGSSGSDRVEGTAGDDRLFSGGGDDRILGKGGNDRIEAGDGRDFVNAGSGDDFVFGGASRADLRDELYGGTGDDNISGGFGNDLLVGQAGDDRLNGGFGADELRGLDGADVLNGAALSDLVFGNAGDDFVNGGFGNDRINGGDGADQFFHIGAAGHGSDFIQDFSADEGDTLLYGRDAAPGDFRLNTAETPNAGQDGVEEAFVTHAPSGLILFALIDGAAQDELRLTINGEQTFDLMA